MGSVESYQDRSEGPTPEDGAFSVAYWRDVRGRPCRKQDAAGAEIVEFDGNNRVIFRTYLQIQPVIVPLD